MINIKVKVHDKFSFEFKTSFIAPDKSQNDDANEFSINTWIFVPNTLDINRITYSKKQFYRDTKSNIRLITPVYSLKEIYSEHKESPINKLKKALQELTENPSDESKFQNYTFQVKMFSSILKSASRDHAYYIIEETNDILIPDLINEYIEDVTSILQQYRSLRTLVNHSFISEDKRQYFYFGDDFNGNVIEQHVFKLMRMLENRPVYNSIKPELYELITKEDKYKKEKSYACLNHKDTTDNFLVVMRRSILKKFIESDLYLNTKNVKDGAFAKQFYYGIAAGISMIFATIVAFTVQQRYGNFTLPLFFALVISYIFKDRIKDLMRFYFSTQLGKKYFDNKRELEMQNEKIGWVKESFDFVVEGKTPDTIMNMRKRSPLVKAENEIYNEQIILYKKLARLSSSEISAHKGYKFIGINDITRFNLTNFVQKMDNSFVPIYIPDKKDGYVRFMSEKVYALHIILRCQGNENLYYRKFRLLFNREGIKEITEINE